MSTFPDNYTIAKEYFALSYSDRTFKKLIEVLQLPCNNVHALESKLSKAVKEWESLNRVKHIVLKGDETFLPRNPDMENDLRSKYSLRGAIVVEVGSLAKPEKMSREDPEAWFAYDDRIHFHLGVWGGRMLSSLVRPSDTIATGGGRGPHYVAKHFLMSEKVGYTGDVVSMTGQMTAHCWKTSSNGNGAEPRSLDADFIASFLQSSLCTKGQLRQLNCAITKKASVQKPTTEKVDVAIVGIGALGGGHRLKRYVGVDELDSVAPLIREINRRAEKLESAQKQPGECEHVIGDVCNHYFLIGRPTKKAQISEWQALEKLVDNLNKEFLNTTPQDLAEVVSRGIVVAVAGGPRKVSAIRHVLEASRATPWISHLVTDNFTAECLMKQPSVQKGRTTKKMIRPLT